MVCRSTASPESESSSMNESGRPTSKCPPVMPKDISSTPAPAAPRVQDRVSARTSEATSVATPDMDRNEIRRGSQNPGPNTRASSDTTVA